MERYSVKMSPRAFKDVEGIYAYIAMEKLSPENAKNQTNRIWTALKKLEVFPYAHQERLEGRYAGKGYRQLLIDNYIGIYRVDESSKTVYIVTVQYHGRNL